MEAQLLQLLPRVSTPFREIRVDVKTLEIELIDRRQMVFDQRFRVELLPHEQAVA